VNTAPVCAGFDPALRLTRRLLLQQIAIHSAGAFNVRAERLVLRGMFRDWPERAIEALLEQLLARASGAPSATTTDRRNGGRSNTSLARVNGCDKPDSARGAHGPKTPAARNGVATFVAACIRGGRAVLAGDTPSLGALQRGSREVVA
jgi:hypothetical protein